MDIELIRNNRAQMIFRFSIPSIIAMVLTSLITVADGFFIGNYVGEEGIAAVNLGLPIIYLFLAIGLMTAVGGSAIAGMAMGAGDIKKCNAVFNQTMLTTAIASVGLSILVFVLFDPMLTLFGATGVVAEHFRTYYGILLFELPIMIMNSSFGMFIRGEGNPQFFMKVSVLGVALNIVLDYVFAKLLLLGVAGIAYASLISVLVSLACIVLFFARKSKVYKLGTFKFDAVAFKNTMLNGFSEFVGEMSMCISMFAYNYVIMRSIGVDGVTAFTVVGYVSYIFSMVIVGFGQGISPLLSFTYGAQEHDLAISIRKKTNLFVFVAGAAVTALMFIISDWYSGVFVESEAVRTMIRSGIYIFTSSFLLAGVNTITSFYFTSIGKATESAVISSARGLVILLAAIFTLPALLGMTGVWLASPITEALTILISAMFIVRSDRISCNIG